MQKLFSSLFTVFSVFSVLTDRFLVCEHMMVTVQQDFSCSLTKEIYE